VVVSAITVIPEVSIQRLTEIVVHAESRGFSRCWVNDEGIAAHDVYVTMAAMALATTSINIGPGITNPYTRHPSSTAGAIAAIDHLSGGRCFLGIGAGGSLTLDPVGLKRHRPVQAVRETIETCRLLFSGERSNTAGDFVKLHEAQMNGARADIEIWLAGRGPRMLKLGAAACDGVMLEFIYKPHLVAVIERVRQAAVQAGKHPKISYSTMVVTDDRSMAVAKQHLTYRLVDSPADVKYAIGLSDSDSDLIRASLADGLEAAAELVREEWVLPFVISGSTSECAEELEQLTDASSIDEFAVAVLDAQNAEHTIDTVNEMLR
jgi:5,10-methylenetetrahydromethanopterin reductase